MAEYADAMLGNLAYNNKRAGTAIPDIEAPVREETGSRTAAEKPRERVHIQTAVKPKSRQYIPFFAIVGTLVVALIIVRLLVCYVSITKLSSESADLEKQITQLKEDQSKLEIKYESAFNLQQVEQYAMAELGMVKAGNEQKVYINNQLDDKAVVLSGEKPAAIDKIKALINSLLVYLK